MPPTPSDSVAAADVLRLRSETRAIIADCESSIASSCAAVLALRSRLEEAKAHPALHKPACHGAPALPAGAAAAAAATAEPALTAK